MGHGFVHPHLVNAFGAPAAEGHAEVGALDGAGAGGPGPADAAGVEPAVRGDVGAAAGEGGEGR